VENGKSEHILIMHLHNNSINTRDRERITPDQYPKRKDYNNPIPLLCENPKA